MLSCQNLKCHRPVWNVGPSTVQDISLQFPSGNFHLLCGPDGCGKGLLLHLLGLLEEPDSGTIAIDGHSIHQLAQDERNQLRNRHFGFLFSMPCLLPSFTVAENVAMPLFRYQTIEASAACQTTREILALLDILTIEDESVFELSSELKFRTALARALVHRPKYLLAVSVPHAEILAPLARDAMTYLGITVIWAGDEPSLEQYADRIIAMDSGLVRKDYRP